MNADKVKIKTENMERLAAYRRWLRAHPRLAYLFLELTDRCNLRCLHCGSSCGGQGTRLDTGLLLNCLETVAQDFEPARVMLCLTGGEPLLHPDFYPIVERIVALGFPWGMTTNATLIDAPAAARLKALGLASVTVSLDGLEASHEALRNSPGCFRRTVEAIECLNRAGIPVQVTTVVHKGNLGELEDLERFLRGLGLRSWRLVNLEPIGRALDHRDLLLDREELLRLLDFIRARRCAADTPMEVCFGCSHYLSFEYEHELRDNYFLCGSGIYVASILCNGDIYSCLDIRRRPELVQGNIAVDRFSQVWRERFQPFRADRTAACDLCRTCPEREFCGGDSTHTWDFEGKKPDFCIRRKELYL